MKQLLILSGKRGTGKTTIASAFIKLSEAKAYADCDVDAPNLHLITEQNAAPQETDFYGLPKAEIDTNLCIGCDQCREKCRFDAIFTADTYQVDPFACEGCGVCQLVCTVEAVTLKPAIAGNLNLYANRKQVFSTAQLKMGNGTSGLLVSEVKKQMRLAAPATNLAIIDGSPGIGCPVIASLSGVDMVLIVAEPSLSGISDMERIIQTAKSFGVQIAVCISKFDTNLANTKKIKEFCIDHKLPFVGKVPYDSQTAKAINSGNTIVDIECTSGTAVKKMYDKTIELLF